jgi:hypothetical protein
MLLRVRGNVVRSVSATLKANKPKLKPEPKLKLEPKPKLEVARATKEAIKGKGKRSRKRKSTT